LLLSSIVSADVNIENKYSEKNKAIKLINPLPDTKDDFIFSIINIRAREKTLSDTGGYFLFYFAIALGDYHVWWNVDYTVWISSGSHRHGIRNDVANSFLLGPILISFGMANFDWEDFSAGNFQVKLLFNGDVVSTDYGGDDDYDGEFEVDAGGDYEGEVGESIQFSGRAEGGVEPYSWLWYFGDGANSTEQNPTHAYSEEGEYEVLLVVTDATNATASDDTEAEIEDEEFEFEADAGGDYEGEVNETIQFYGYAEGGEWPYTWLWYFGYGANSTEQNPTHAYSEEGEYEVLLVVTDAANNTASDDTEAKIEYDDGDDEFEADAGGDYEAEVNETIQFYGSAEGGVEPYTWYWDFGDGYNSTEQNPTHAYSEEGEYEVILIVTDAENNTATDETEAEIGEEDDDEGFEADAGDDYEAEVNETIQFYGSAEGGVEPYSWLWYFGDGETSTEQNPTHAYSEEGEYQVVLVVTDAENNAATDETEAEIGED